MIFLLLAGWFLLIGFLVGANHALRRRRAPTFFILTSPGRFAPSDVGNLVSGPGLPPGCRVVEVRRDGSVVLSNQARPEVSR